MRPGSEIIITPKNPTITASHLYKRTFSFNKNIEKIVVNIGAAKVILTTVAKGRFLSATNIEIKSKSGDFLYYKPYPYTLCMSSKSPFTSNADVGDIKKKLVLGYKIYYY